MRTRKRGTIGLLAVGAAVAVSVSAICISLGSGVVTSAASSHATVNRAEAKAVFTKELKAMLATARIARVKNQTAAEAFNWSGYADTSKTDGAFTQVSGSFTVPSISCTSEDQIDAFWVGLDGYADSTVEQDGVDEQCFQGVAIYYSWYEMYPAGTTVEGSTVKPGDAISTSVSRSGKNYTLALTDSTTSGNSFSVTAKCKTTVCLDTSAEWIAERPAYETTGIVPLAHYSSWTLTNAKVNTSDNIASFKDYEITMIDSTETYPLNTPSALNGANNSFSTSWNDSY
jgi:F0F1-type ATP synthase membrane subunit c/vacuolar-type H+-ATPase subunit K